TGLSKFLTCKVEPVLGSISANDIVDSKADSTQTRSIRKKNRTAGSGSLLPAFSIKSKKRVMAGFFKDGLLSIGSDFSIRSLFKRPDIIFYLVGCRGAAV